MHTKAQDLRSPDMKNSDIAILFFWTFTIIHILADFRSPWLAAFLAISQNCFSFCPLLLLFYFSFYYEASFQCGSSSAFIVSGLWSQSINVIPFFLQAVQWVITAYFLPNTYRSFSLAYLGFLYLLFCISFSSFLSSVIAQLPPLPFNVSWMIFVLWGFLKHHVRFLALY